ncbi:DsbA family protein [Pectobacterium carotovorum]|uniref:DsbA family protein n=1 Tax=Pectobacterium carotovorum TaxID=554 RepID=UPI001CF0DF27|nr:DsbA family protein [Pectobacterium carotovorum]MCA6971893.1 DsbA family protein [Pectobacterium carotovorum]
MLCDNETGQCLIDTKKELSPIQDGQTEKEAVIVHYVGDPMCSWCWGISQSVSRIAAFCHDNHYQFTLTNGGLRAGGGDEWNTSFKNFLRREWEHISSKTGQSFSYALLDAEYFNYDTEPACRAVVSAELIAKDTKIEFFRETQRKFYTQSEDPKKIEFYESICLTTGIDFDDFKNVFTSKFAITETISEFYRARHFGVNAFPTILIEKDSMIKKIASGYVSEKEITNILIKNLS